MNDFNYKKFLAEGTLLKENSPGFEDRKYGESLPTLESIQLAYEAKQGYDDELDDSLGAKHGSKEQDMDQRRADSENMEKSDGDKKYSGDKSKDKGTKKVKKESIDTKLAEIDKEAQGVALEAKIEAIDEIIEAKNQRIKMVTEDDNLSELVDKKKMKEMQREVKDLEKRKAKLEKLYEKMCGKSYTKEEMVDEEMPTELNEGKTTMKKSELKEMIKSAMMAEAELTINDTTDAYDPLYEEDAYENRSEFDTNKPGRVGEFIKALDSLVDEYHAELYLNDELFAAMNDVKTAAKSEMGSVEIPEIPGFEGTRDALDNIKLDYIEEAEEEDIEVEDEENVDVDIEKDVKVDDEESEVDVDVTASMPGENEAEEEVQAMLMKAQQAATELGDDKLTDQIGNTITYFTRQHVSKVDTNESINESTVRRGNDGLINKLL